MNQQSQYQQPRRTGTYSSQHDELHMSQGMAQQGQQMSPREYSSSGAPQIRLDHSSPSLSQMGSYQGSGSVPNVLQPGGMGGRAPTIPSNAPVVPSMQHQSEYQPQQHQTPSKPNSLNLSHSHSHSYSRSSPSAPYEPSAGGSGYVPYTPTTPGGGASSQYMSPTDPKYNTSNSQRNVSNTPLGLSDIRPRADSSLSDGLTPGYEQASSQSRTSNYMAPWASYAFDWCKWSPQGNSAGKLAIGSYLEDGHNFVSGCCYLVGHLGEPTNRRM
jgi:WD repeat-containing protein 68